MSKCESLFLLSYCIEFHQILCHFIDSTLYFGFGLCPFLRSQLIQLRALGSISRSIFLDNIQPGRQNIEITTIPVFYLDIVFYDLIYFYLFNTLIDAQSMILMYNIITYLQI